MFNVNRQPYVYDRPGRGGSSHRGRDLLQKMLILVCCEFRCARGHDRIRGGDVGWRLGPVPICERLDGSHLSY